MGRLPACLLILVAVLLVAVGASAYTFAAQPARSQPTAARSAAGQPPAGLQQAADQMVADGTPGVIIMTRRGQQVSDVVAGLADTATGQPMQAQDRVHIGSITKTFVATVVLQLAAEGRLSLNDSVQKWLPGVITRNGYDPVRITIRELLNMTSGIPDHLNDTALFGNPNNPQPGTERGERPDRAGHPAPDIGTRDRALRLRDADSARTTRGRLSHHVDSGSPAMLASLAGPAQWISLPALRGDRFTSRWP